MEQVYGVWAVRSAASMFGHAEAWCKEDGRPLEFESLEAAQAYALELNRKATVNIRYLSSAGGWYGQPIPAIYSG